MAVEKQQSVMQLLQMQTISQVDVSKHFSTLVSSELRGSNLVEYSHEL
ncbi:hypothetical protein J2Y37_002032 [Prolinoborus sp. 3657]|nr:hypothetical protein [Prolinoborus sp. 3657]